MWELMQQRGTRRGTGLRHAATRSLYRYWNDLRGDRPAPFRREIEPADIGPVLSDTFILEAIDDRTYGYRLAGSRVGAAFGRELKGENWLAGWTQRDGEALSTLLRSIVCDAAVATVRFRGDNAGGQSAPFETLLLPLVNRGRGYTRILGAMLPLAEPYWLGAHPLVAREITDLRLVWPDATEMAEAPAGPSDPRPLARRRHLVLYDGGLSD